MTDRSVALAQDADRKRADGTPEGQRSLRPDMVMAIRGDDGGVSPKHNGLSKGMSQRKKEKHVLVPVQCGGNRAVQHSEKL